MLDTFSHSKYFGINLLSRVDKIRSKSIMRLFNLVNFLNILLNLYLYLGKKCGRHGSQVMNLIIEASIERLIGASQTLAQFIIGLFKHSGLLLKTSGDVLKLIVNHI